MTDPKVGEASFGLGAPIMIRRHFNRAHRIGLHSHVTHRGFATFSWRTSWWASLPVPFSQALSLPVLSWQQTSLPRSSLLATSWLETSWRALSSLVTSWRALS